MNISAASQKIADQLDSAMDRKVEVGLVESAEDSVNAMLKSWPRNQGIYAQLQRLATFIDQTKSEISALRPSEVNGKFIPSATDELDAIVEATATASNKIMDSADVFMDLVAHLPPEHADTGMNAVTAIYEACTFQDITGQRITKVVGLLKVIEDRLSAMSGEVSGTEYPAPDVARDESITAQPESVGVSQDDIDSFFSAPLGAPDNETGVSDEELLNGPALPGQEKSQADIDALFDSA